MKMIIYKATNKITGKCYIGKTTLGLKRRIRGHHDYASDNKLSKNSAIFHKAINSYGRDNFEWTILAECDDNEELNRLEIKFIKEFNSMQPEGYNMTGGGGMYGYSLSEETKQSISDTVKLLHKDPEYRAKNYPKLKGLIPPNKGVPMSEEQKLKVGAARKAVYDDPNYVNPNKGQKRSGVALENLKAAYETRELPTGDKWKEAHKDQYTVETRAKMSAARIGKKPANTKRVMCIETGQVFNGLTDASTALNVNRQSIYLQIKGKLKSAGGLHFRYLEDIKAA